MTITAFILGIIVGLGFYCWKRYQFNRQMQQTLYALSDNPDRVSSLSTQSLVRREIVYLNQQRQQLTEELQTVKSLLDKSPLGYLQVDEENQLLWCNQQAQQLLGIDRWQPGQIRLLLELVRSYELDQLIERTRHTQQPQVQEWVFYPIHYAAEGNLNNRRQTPLSYGQSVALKAFSYPLLQGQIGVFIENQQPLVELSQSRDRAFSDLTHELRTPLTAISLVAETLQKRLQNPERQWVERMLKETSRLMNLIQDWLDISQLQADPNQHLCYQSLELRELILSAWQSLEPLAQQKAVTINYSGPEHIYLQGDKSRLTQVFLNLFDNGIKHSPVQGVLQVEVQQVTENQDTTVQINLIDSGPGFSSSDLPYIFDRLYRGDQSRARQSSDFQVSEQARSRHGSGLGLSIVHQIIQAHGGSIQAKNHPQTGGAWLQLTLPMQQSQAFSSSSPLAQSKLH